MTGTDPSTYSVGWLALREPADARARATVLVADVVAALPAGELVVHDLGCGTGSMGRWLAPLLPGPQHWVLHDRDPELLRLATAGLPSTAAGAPVRVEARTDDVTALTPDDLRGARLVTASALLDVLTRSELTTLAEACAGARCPALLTLSVVGRVRLEPADPRDALVAAAFDDHQRRPVQGRRLLGPDAVAVAAEAFGRLGADVRVADSPWLLGPDDAALTAAWLRGWVAAAAEQHPELPLGDYLERRIAETTAGRSTVTVGHADLLVRWP